MSKEYRKKWLADKQKANKGRLTRLGSYQSSKYKSIVLTIDGQKVELNRLDYAEYIKGIKVAKLASADSESKGFDPKTGEPL